MQIISIDSSTQRRHPGFKFQSTRTSTLQHACGKAILVGEHAVVYGAPAIALPLPGQRIQVSLDLALSKTLERDRLIVNGDHLPPDACNVISDAFQLLGLKPSPVYIEGHSNLAMGAGLGSSASLCVVTIRAIAGAFGITLDRRDVARLGNELEKRFHGNPSGLDTAVVAYEQVIEFRRGCDPQPLVTSPISLPNGTSKPWRFALIDSRTRAATKAMIDLARPYFTGPKQSDIMGEFELIAKEAVRGLSQGDFEAVAGSMQLAHSHLQKSGVVTPQIESIIESCLAIGCRAAKSTGAGGGGTLIALLDPENAVKQFSDLVSRFGHDFVHEVQLPCGN